MRAYKVNYNIIYVKGVRLSTVKREEYILTS